MAEIRSIYTKKRTERRTDADRRQSACVEGATVRKLREPERRQSREKQLSVQTSRRTKPEQRMGIGYVLFLAAALGAVAMAVVSVPVNYYISYPVYAKMFGGLDQIIAAYQVLRPGTDGLMEALLVFNMPFTLLKGTIDAALTFLIYKPLSPVLHGRR